MLTLATLSDLSQIKIHKACKQNYMLLICKRQAFAIVYTPINIIDISLNYLIISSTQ